MAFGPSLEEVMRLLQRNSFARINGAPNSSFLHREGCPGRLPEFQIMKGLILAQNERWRRGLGMQVERESLLREASRAAKG